MFVRLKSALSLTAITLALCSQCQAAPASQPKIRAGANLAHEQHVYQKLASVDRLMAQSRFVDARLVLLDLLQYKSPAYASEVESLLAECCYRLGNAREAMSHYQSAIKYDAKNWRLYWNAALCSMNLGQYAQAIVFAHKVLINNPPKEIRAEATQFVLDMQEKLEQPQAVVDIQSDDYIDSLLASHNANRWAMDRMPLKVYIRPFDSTSKTANQNIVVSSLNQWARATGGKISFVLTTKPLIADITLGFTTDTNDIVAKPEMTPVELGLTRFSLSTNYQPRDRINLTSQLQAVNDPYSKIERAEVLILLLKPISQKPLNTDEIKEITLHELGHALGLAGHSDNSSDIMYFNQSFSQLPALTKRDRASIARLYQDYPVLEQSGVVGSQFEPLKLPQRNTP